MEGDEDEKEIYALHWDDNKDFNEYTPGFTSLSMAKAITEYFVWWVLLNFNGLVCLTDDLYRYYHNFSLSLEPLC